jgi:hypothetical protein
MRVELPVVVRWVRSPKSQSKLSKVPRVADEFAVKMTMSFTLAWAGRRQRDGNGAFGSTVYARTWVACWPAECVTVTLTV